MRSFILTPKYDAFVQSAHSFSYFEPHASCRSFGLDIVIAHGDGDGFESLGGDSMMICFYPIGE